MFANPVAIPSSENFCVKVETCSERRNEGMRERFKGLWHSLKRFHSEERGQGMTEYVLIVVLIAIAVIIVVTLFGGRIKAMFSGATQQLSTVSTIPTG